MGLTISPTDSPSSDPSKPGYERHRDIRRVTIVGGVIDLILGVLKIVAGNMAHSQALIADGLHSLSDLATDFLVIFASRHANRDADRDHPYGHGRIETLATVLMGTVLLIVAFGIVYDAGFRLFHPNELLNPNGWALVVAGISVLAKELIYHYTMSAARRLRSDLLRANAWHSRSDAISSIVVVIGVAGTMAGLPYLDAIAAVGVALMIAKIAWDLSINSLRELIDTGLDHDRIEVIERAIQRVDGVRALHLLRTRQSAGAALVDVHIQVDSKLSVSEGHQIGEAVRGTLMNQIEEITDVTIHIDPEDDETCSPCDHLPERAELLARLKQRWKGIPVAAEIEDLTLHYLDGKVDVEVVVPLGTADNQTARLAADALTQAAQAMPEIGAVKVYFH